LAPVSSRWKCTSISHSDQPDCGLFQTTNPGSVVLIWATPLNRTTADFSALLMVWPYPGAQRSRPVWRTLRLQLLMHTTCTSCVDVQGAPSRSPGSRSHSFRHQAHSCRQGYAGADDGTRPERAVRHHRRADRSAGAGGE
jgi:hypothetical protein